MEGEFSIFTMDFKLSITIFDNKNMIINIQKVPSYFQAVFGLINTFFSTFPPPIYDFQKFCTPPTGTPHLNTPLYIYDQLRQNCNAFIWYNPHQNLHQFLTVQFWSSQHVALLNILQLLIYYYVYLHNATSRMPGIRTQIYLFPFIRKKQNFETIDRGRHITS